MSTRVRLSYVVPSPRVGREPLNLSLPSGLEIRYPQERLQAYCEEEYDLYDAVPVIQNSQLSILDIVLTTSVNGNLTASDVGRIWRRRAEIEEPLADVDSQASLLDGNWPRQQVVRLLTAACAIPSVKLAVATKILHKKRPTLVPMIDSVILQYYFRRRPYERWPAYGEIAAQVMDQFRNDLLAVITDLQATLNALQLQNGWSLTPVRALEILVWMVKQRRWYQKGPWAE